MQAALFMKLMAFHTNLADGDFSIHVVNSPQIADEFKTFIGKKAGKATLTAVTEGGGPPSGWADVVYVGSNASEIISFTRANSVLSIAGNPEYVNSGVTLGLKLENGKPKILLNLTSTKLESINWNPAIFKVASTID